MFRFTGYKKAWKSGYGSFMENKRRASLLLGREAPDGTHRESKPAVLFSGARGVSRSENAVRF
jgi:hypothetical protein